jgi:hypothetical protein
MILALAIVAIFYGLFIDWRVFGWALLIGVAVALFS